MGGMVRIHESPAARQRGEPVGLPCCFLKKNSKTTFSFAPGQTEFITVSPTCLWVPEVCHCLAGSDLGAVARQTLRAQTCFYLIFAVLGLFPWQCWDCMEQRSEPGEENGWTGSAHREGERSPSTLLWGKTTSWDVCDTIHSSGVDLRGC